MRIRTLQLINFKRFDNLTINLGETPAKVVALIGPNGSGKSSVFDAFEQVLQQWVGANSRQQPWFYSKTWHARDNPQQTYHLHQSIRLTTNNGLTFPDNAFEPRNFYVRSAYRYTPQLRVSSIQQLQEAVTDGERPGSSVGLDQRLQKNYERLLGQLITSFWKGDKTGAETRAELVESINVRLRKVLDIQITDLGDVSAGQGQLFFEKGNSKNFPFENLSAGEKEVVDLIIDLQVKVQSFNDTVFCIDEPEIHLNTSIQRRLLAELVDLVGDTNQLWIATHSVGFLRALQEDLQDQSQILDFSSGNYFDGEATLTPMRRTRANWQRVFSTALEDITGLVAPNRIIYCEGNEIPNADGGEQGLDATVYNTIFETSHPDAMFVSAGGGGAQIRNATLALAVMSKALPRS